jgi:4-diphosphocytidyl-2-C-methyl-D-erythritol kinase
MATIVEAHAKLTLSLRITGIRADGYHLIDAEMVSLDLHDTLTITEGDGLEIAQHGGPARAVPVGDDNLVRRAQALAGMPGHVVLEKRIPAGAGLGGGSADAAAVLRVAGFHDLEAAAALGADIPFCLVGGRARVRGIGEIIEPLPVEDRTFTVLTPPFGCATVAVYRAWDELGGPVGDHGNDLEPAALRVEPRLAHWRDRLQEMSGLRPRLAGSGSSWFVEGTHPGEGCVVVRTVAG